MTAKRNSKLVDILLIAMMILPIVLCILLQILFKPASEGINVEGALIDAADDGTRGVFFHSMNPKAAPFFGKLGADIWSIGNNHTMDAGAAGIVNTKKCATENGAVTFGAGLNEQEASEPVYVEGAGGIGI